jgi:folate-binding protein YgfZ
MDTPTPSSQIVPTSPAGEVRPAGSPPAVVLPNPLYEAHARAEAEFQPYASLEVVSTFGEPQAEYAAFRKGCAMCDLPQRGILELTGRDRLAFLNNLLTNETWSKSTKVGLAAGKGVYAFFLNLKGRIVADLNVMETGERTYLEMDGRYVESLRATFDKYLFAEQVRMTSRIGQLHEIALHGPGAAAVLDAAIGAHLTELPPMGSTQVRLFDREATVWRDDPCGVPGLHLIVATADALEIWTNFISQFGQPVEHGRRPIRPAGWAAFNACRIEAARPMFGIDFDDSILPAEIGPATFERAVSVTKGCYLGQEIVARMHARKQVARQWVGLKVENDSLPLAGAQLFDDAVNVIGGITSSTVSPILSNAAICLGYLKRPFFAEGTTVQVPAEGSLRKATVVKTPFL